MNNSQNNSPTEETPSSNAMNFLMDSSTCFPDNMFYNQGDQAAFLNLFNNMNNNALSQQQQTSASTQLSASSSNRQQQPQQQPQQQQKNSYPAPNQSAAQQQQQQQQQAAAVNAAFLAQVSAAAVAASAAENAKRSSARNSQTHTQQQQQQQQQLPQIQPSSAVPNNLPMFTHSAAAAAMMMNNMIPSAAVQGYQQQILNSQRPVAISGANIASAPGTNNSNALNNNQVLPRNASNNINTRNRNASGSLPNNAISGTENMTGEEKRRFERNQREQQRSFKISQQIKELRNVLQESNIPFKPNKYSILHSVVDYIKELQTRAIYLDQEHQNLLNTISATNELVNSGNSGEKFGRHLNQNEDESGNGSRNNFCLGNDSELLFVKGLDYKSVFSQCSSALCVASLDGRLLDCNAQFEKISGYEKEELQDKTLFNFLTNPAMEALFVEMGQLLQDNTSQENQGDKGKTSSDEKKQEESPSSSALFWRGQVQRRKTSQNNETSKDDDSDLYMNITLAKSRDGRPQYLNCALTC